MSLRSVEMTRTMKTKGQTSVSAQPNTSKAILGEHFGSPLQANKKPRCCHPDAYVRDLQDKIEISLGNEREYILRNVQYLIVNGNMP